MWFRCFWTGKILCPSSLVVVYLVSFIIPVQSLNSFVLELLMLWDFPQVRGEGRNELKI